LHCLVHVYLDGHFFYSCIPDIIINGDTHLIYMFMM